MRKHDLVANLAKEFNVSERTIRRDIEELSLYQPIYTKSGRHGGGVFISEDFCADQPCFNKAEATAIGKAIECFEQGKSTLSTAELQLLKQIQKKYTIQNQ